MATTISVVISVCVFFTTIVTLLAAPALRYDQRQEGETNIRANLDNFIVLIIPASGDGIGDSLLNLLLSAKRKSIQIKAGDRISNESGPDNSPLSTSLSDNVNVKPNHVSKPHSPKSVDFPTVSSVQLKTLTLDETLVIPAVEVSVDQVQRALLAPKTLDVPPTILSTGPVQEITLEQLRKAKAISTTLQTSAKSTEKLRSQLERNLLDSNVKSVSSGIEICGTNERRDEDGNCKPITSKYRGPTPSVLSFGLVPASD